ncbi:cupin domain-containing protein [Gordonia sp. L191]|uniref:cupin domain-containing protein n=1 Tax=Gordonia sp. L191 TaxID=2982699 RepID=UPI0024C0702A|nr:cupin domain-containing protein [Gordonia sp. L191]WHU45487.1 cupin domain-containing protein [Gordonia sp. L191]
MSVVVGPVVHGMHGARFESFVAPSRGSAELCAWRTVLEPEQFGTAHRVDREEIFLVLTGDPECELDGRRHTLAVGSVVHVPAGSRVRLDNPGSAEASVWVTAPAGLTAVTDSGETITPPWAR